MAKDPATKSLKNLSPEELADASQSELQLLRLHEELRKSESNLAKYRRDNDHLKQRLNWTESELHFMEQRLQIVDIVKEDEGVEKYAISRHRSHGPATAVLVLNDWHLEERVDPEVVSGLNDYSLEIASKRIERVCQGFLDCLRASRTMSNVNDVVIGILGDMLTGYIHEELVEGNACSPIEAVVILRRHLRGVIEFVLEHAGVKGVTVVTNHGNHGRTGPKKRIATGYANSYEWLLYQILADDFAFDKRVKFQNTKGYFNMVEIQGKRVRFHHGDNVKYGGGIGGITIPIRKAISEWNEGVPADLDIMGHFHQSLFDKRFVVCNALIGFNAFCIAIKARYARPSQTYLVIDKNRPGYVEGREIYCD